MTKDLKRTTDHKKIKIEEVTVVELCLRIYSYYISASFTIQDDTNKT